MSAYSHTKRNGRDALVFPSTPFPVASSSDATAISRGTSSTAADPLTSSNGISDSNCTAGGHSHEDHQYNSHHHNHHHHEDHFNISSLSSTPATFNPLNSRAPTSGGGGTAATLHSNFTSRSNTATSFQFGNGGGGGSAGTSVANSGCGAAPNSSGVGRSASTSTVAIHQPFATATNAAANTTTSVGGAAAAASSTSVSRLAGPSSPSTSNSNTINNNTNISSSRDVVPSPSSSCAISAIYSSTQHDHRPCVGEPFGHYVVRILHPAQGVFTDLVAACACLYLYRSDPHALKSLANHWATLKAKELVCLSNKQQAAAIGTNNNNLHNNSSQHSSPSEFSATAAAASSPIPTLDGMAAAACGGASSAASEPLPLPPPPPPPHHSAGSSRVTPTLSFAVPTAAAGAAGGGAVASLTPPPSHHLLPNTNNPNYSNAQSAQSNMVRERIGECAKTHANKEHARLIRADMPRGLGRGGGGAYARGGASAGSGSSFLQPSPASSQHLLAVGHSDYDDHSDYDEIAANAAACNSKVGCDGEEGEEVVGCSPIGGATNSNGANSSRRSSSAAPSERGNTTNNANTTAVSAALHSPLPPPNICTSTCPVVRCTEASHDLRAVMNIGAVEHEEMAVDRREAAAANSTPMRNPMDFPSAPAVTSATRPNHDAQDRQRGVSDPSDPMSAILSPTTANINNTNTHNSSASSSSASATGAAAGGADGGVGAAAARSSSASPLPLADSSYSVAGVSGADESATAVPCSPNNASVNSMASSSTTGAAAGTDGGGGALTSTASFSTTASGGSSTIYSCAEAKLDVEQLIEHFLSTLQFCLDSYFSYNWRHVEGLLQVNQDHKAYVEQEVIPRLVRLRHGCNNTNINNTTPLTSAILAPPSAASSPNVSVPSIVQQQQPSLETSPARGSRTGDDGEGTAAAPSAPPSMVKRAPTAAFIDSSTAAPLPLAPIPPSVTANLGGASSPASLGGSSSGSAASPVSPSVLPPIAASPAFTIPTGIRWATARNFSRLRAEAADCGLLLIFHAPFSQPSCQTLMDVDRLFKKELSSAVSAKAAWDAIVIKRKLPICGSVSNFGGAADGDGGGGAVTVKSPVTSDAAVIGRMPISFSSANTSTNNGGGESSVVATAGGHSMATADAVEPPSSTTTTASLSAFPSMSNIGTGSNINMMPFCIPEPEDFVPPKWAVVNALREPTLYAAFKVSWFPAIVYIPPVRTDGDDVAGDGEEGRDAAAADGGGGGAPSSPPALSATARAAQTLAQTLSATTDNHITYPEKGIRQPRYLLEWLLRKGQGGAYEKRVKNTITSFAVLSRQKQFVSKRREVSGALSLIKRQIHDPNPLPHTAEDPPVFVMMGGGMAAGKTTATSALEQTVWWHKHGNNAVVIDADEFKFHDPLFKANSPDLHKRSVEAAEHLLVDALNEGRDIVFDGTMSWLPYVQQTFEMVREAHLYYYKRCPIAYNPEKGLEEYWERAGLRETPLPAPYVIKFVGITVDPSKAVQRGILRRVNTGRSVPVRQQLRSFRLFSQGFKHYCAWADALVLYNNNVRVDLSAGQLPKVIAEKRFEGTYANAPSGGGGVGGASSSLSSSVIVHDPSAYNDFQWHDHINQDATSEEDLWLAQPRVPDWEKESLQRLAVDGDGEPDEECHQHTQQYVTMQQQSIANRINSTNSGGGGGGGSGASSNNTSSVGPVNVSGTRISALSSPHCNPTFPLIRLDRSVQATFITGGAE